MGLSWQTAQEASLKTGPSPSSTSSTSSNSSCPASKRASSSAVRSARGPPRVVAPACGSVGGGTTFLNSGLGATVFNSELLESHPARNRLRIVASATRAAWCESDVGIVVLLSRARAKLSPVFRRHYWDDSGETAAGFH